MSSSKWMPLRIRDCREGFIHLFYPELCVACERDLPVQASCFCLSCQLKNTVFSLDTPNDNPFTTRLWGRIPLKWGVSAYHFTRKSPIQKALHHLKYKNKPDIGWMMGRELGKRLLHVPQLPMPDWIIPVPLHPKKERQRGYNQSALFAKGLSESMGTPAVMDGLRRQHFTGTQTQKKRMQRFENVDNVFAVHQSAALRGKHLLLVDDVLTTGATLEMCGAALLQMEGVQLSMATIAIADL